VAIGRAARGSNAGGLDAVGPYRFGHAWSVKPAQEPPPLDALAYRDSNTRHKPIGYPP
jgi:hypothetical protein